MALAAETEADLFVRYPHGAGRYAGRLLCLEPVILSALILHAPGQEGEFSQITTWSTR